MFKPDFKQVCMDYSLKFDSHYREEYETSNIFSGLNPDRTSSLEEFVRSSDLAERSRASDAAWRKIRDCLLYTSDAADE